MKSLIKRDKLSFSTLQQEMERFFNERFWPFNLGEEDTGMAHWAPAVDIKEEKEENDKGWHRTERFTGSFYRRLALPESADASQVTATSKKGVLEIRVPMSKKTRKSRIEVKSSD